MTHKLAKLLVALNIAILFGSGTAFAAVRIAPPEKAVEATYTLNVKGALRKYILFTPSGKAKGPRPLVIVLHGGGGNGEQAKEMSSWNYEAQRRGWVVAYPYGSSRPPSNALTWNAGQCCGYASESGVDDVSFIDRTIEDIAKRTSIDSSRVYVTGMSNGAMLAYKLACELSSKIAAIAPVAGTSGNAVCKPAFPVSVIHFHGTADKNVPYKGGVGQDAFDKTPKKSVANALGEWYSINKCLAPKTTRVVGNATFSTAKCLNQTEVSLVEIRGGGHSWPGSINAYPPFDPVSTDVDATGVMAAFFDRHKRR